jgi:hypothetical protein
MSASASCENDHKYFCEFYQPKTSMYLIHAATLLVSLTNILLSFGIIWFESRLSDHRNTLLNKLKTLFCWSTIISTPIIEFLNVLNYYFGPLSSYACYFLLIFRNILKSNLLVYLNCNAISKYIFIFWMKNPMSIDENFWSTLIVVASIVFSCTMNIVATLLPQKQSIFFYACSDTDPLQDWQLKKVMLFQFEVVITVVIQLTVYFKIKLFKLKATASTSATNEESNFNYKFFISVVASLSWFAIYAYLQVEVNSLSLQEFNTFPKYIFMYFYQLFAMEFTTLVFNAVYYIYNADLREKVRSAAFDLIMKCLYCSRSFFS